MAGAASASSGTPVVCARSSIRAWVSPAGRTALAVVVLAYAVEDGQARSVPWIHAKDTSARPMQRSATRPPGTLTMIAVRAKPMSMGLAMTGTYMPESVIAPESAQLIIAKHRTQTIAVETTGRGVWRAES